MPATDKQKRHTLRRKAEKLQNLSYELKYDASGLRWAGDEHAANTVQDISATLGNLARRLKEAQ